MELLVRYVRLSFFQYDTKLLLEMIYLWIHLCFRLTNIAIDEIECLPITFQNVIEQYCIENKTKALPKLCQNINRKIENKMLNTLYDLHGCAKKCEILNYRGDLQINKDQKVEPKTVAIWYWMVSDELRVEQEYLINDTLGLIGYIGGTLGLFVGFSFFDLFSKLIFVFKYHMNVVCLAYN